MSEPLENNAATPPPDVPPVTLPETPPTVVPVSRRAKWRRRAKWSGISLLALGLLLALVIFAVLRLGYVDSSIQAQIIARLAKSGFRAEIGSFKTQFGPRFELQDLKLYDQQTNELLGTIKNVKGRLRIVDLLALRLSRRLELQEMEIDGLEFWVKFNADGTSNIRNLKPGESSKRIDFDFATGNIALKNSIIHYDDQRYDITANAKNFALQFSPDNASLPVEQRTFLISLSSDGADVTYNDKRIEPVAIRARARVNRQRTDIEELVLRSPFSETTLHGAVDDYQKLSYHLELDSTVDLTQASDVLAVGTTLRGNGSLTGTVKGEGAKYEVQASFKADALAADEVRLKGLTVTAKGGGENQTYDVTGKAVAEMLTAGDFELNQMQLAGQVMGTGTDFRWLGDLQAAAARYGDKADITDLIINDVRAEMKDKQLTAQVGQARAERILNEQATLENFRASGISVVRTVAGAVQATLSNAQVAAMTTKDNSKVRGFSADNLKVSSQNGRTEITTGRATVSEASGRGANIRDLRTEGLVIKDDGTQINITTPRLSAATANGNGATVSSINVAGVRLAVRGGRVSGGGQSVTVSNLKLAANKDLPQGGNISNIRAETVAFTLEPSGRYRASFDLSLGGGILGAVKLGAARAAVTATNDEVQARDFSAQILQGRAQGDATINLGRGASRVNATFTDLDLAALLATATGQASPLVAGKTSGRADLTFAGTDAANASGTVEATFAGDTGGKSDRLPVNGELLVRAERGNFNLERATFRTPASTVTATGNISPARNTADLALDINSSNAQELQALVLSSGLLPAEVQAQADEYADKYGVGGELAFSGTVRGNLSDPTIDGRASLGSLLAQGRNVGSLAATLHIAPSEIRISDGVLRDPTGGTIAFNVAAPRPANDNVTVQATLNDVDAGNLALLAPVALPPAFETLTAKLSGRVNVVGLPQKMSGEAEITSNGGQVSGQNFEQIALRATFTGSNINLERAEAVLPFGRLNATGQVDLTSLKAPGLNLRVRGENLSLAQLVALRATPGQQLPNISGTAGADITLRIPNVLAETFSDAEITVNANAPEVVINGTNAGAVTLTGRTEKGFFDLNLTTGILGQPQTVQARLDLNNQNVPFTAVSTLNNADLTPLIAIFSPDAASAGATARVTGVLNLAGNLFERDPDTGEQTFSLDRLRGTANLTAINVQAQDIQLNGVAPVIVQFSPNELNFERAQFTGTGTNLNLSGTLALSAAGQQNLSVNGKLNLRLLNGFVPDSFFNGVADANLRVGGTFANPRVLGTASIANGAFSQLVGNQRLTLSGVTGEARFNQTQIEISRLEGNLGGGKVVATGGVVLQGFTPSGYRFEVTGNNITVPFPEGFRSTADAQIAINGIAQKSGLQRFVTGSVNLKRAEYNEEIEIADFIARKPETSLSGGGGDGEDDTFAENTFLDLSVAGRDALVIKNSQIDALGSLSVRVTGSVAEPIIGGRVTASRATLEFLGQRYELTRGYVDLPGRLDAEPELNVQAEADIKSYRVTLRLTGPLSQARVELKSDPSLPQPDIVALITTGNLDPAAGSTVLASSQVDSAATLVAEALVNAPVRRATDKLFGLNRFEIDPRISDQGQINPTARLTVGRQINRNLSIIYSTNLAQDQNQVLALEYRVSNRVSFVAQYEQAPVSSFNSKNDIFSFEVRFRKKF